MKFILKDYQEEAVADILLNLKKASRRWHEDGDRHAFSLAATTGAGKTVMAAAVVEALFYGEDSFEFEPDPGAVVIWFSDDPSLNEQTRFRLLEASDKLNYSDLVVVQNSFCDEILSPGKVYFLNTQKLGKKSLLVRGHNSGESIQANLFSKVRPDLRANTIWDTITNTIEDPSLSLYLILDEAHRGMGTENFKNDKSTIVKRLINGSGSVPSIPIVLGVSATVERFNLAMAGAEGRSLLPNVVVDSKKVQESGLLKDTIVLEIPEKVGKFDKVLLARAIEKIKELSLAWEKYATQQGESEAVQPLVVLQVPNTPDEKDIGEAIDLILKNWTDINSNAFAHVFGERKTQNFGNHSVPHISPERVQESVWIRVLIAKDAISTGWDCPRAEVMVSFRPAKDKTHITQLMGRMVRTPLARRISGNDRLNSVDCLLPFFDEKTVLQVADSLMEGSEDGSGPLQGRRVLINPIEVVPDTEVAGDIWGKFESIPSQSLPKRFSKPVKRLTALAHELAADELLNGAGKIAHAEMHKVLDAASFRYSSEIENSRQSVLSVEGKTLSVDMHKKEKSFDEFLEDADLNVIEEAYKRASRELSPDLTRTYSEYLADNYKSRSDREGSLIEAHTKIAAMGLVDEVSDYLDSEADKVVKKWLTEYRVQIKSLSDERQEAYRTIRSWSKEPQDVELSKPSRWMVASTVLEESGKSVQLPRYEKHLLIDVELKSFPCEFNSWEAKVFETEVSREGFCNWYRNPGHNSNESLGIAYDIDGKFSIVRPDFIFFSRKSDGTVFADIIDPHSLHLSDALPKLIGLAKYALTHKELFRRIESVAEVDGYFKALDLKEALVCKAVLEATDAKELFLSKLASDYR